MTFLSLAFLVFLPIFFVLYWYVLDRSLRSQNLFLLAGSWLFYGWWDWRFLFLVAGSSLLNYWLGLGLVHSTSKGVRRILVGAGLLQGLGCLLYFKYFHSFLPLGISFYTFKTISYLLDINCGKIRAETDWVVFFSYVAFFPCVTAGPIDRPGVLIPQLKARRIWDTGRGADGMRQILWGIFKKVVIADNCAPLTADIFANYSSHPASALLFGAFLYTIQLYADFSGYCDMAIGIGSLLGFRISSNFNYPFFAHNIAEYWRRWHMTLTSWLTDYVYMPLSFYLRDYGKAGIILAILVNFVAIGLWHGPSWTFVIFGFLHGCYFIPLVLRRGVRRKRRADITAADRSGVTRIARLPCSRTALNLAAVCGTFLLVMLTNILFRSRSIAGALGYYRGLLSWSLLSRFPVEDRTALSVAVSSIVIMFAAEWYQRKSVHPLQIDFIRPFILRALVYYCLTGLILVFGPANFSEFIYIRF